VVVYALSANIPDEDEAGPTPSRLGLVVRARNRAVVRNRIKRRIRAAFAACDPAPGFDVVVRVDERAEKMPFTDLIGTLSKALADCGVQIRRHGVPR
jgi:ribonuclease P protein component